MKPNADQHITELSDLFNVLNEDHGRIAESLTEAVHQLKEALADKVISNLIEAGMLRECETGLKQRLLTFDLNTLSMWLAQSQVLLKLESKRLGVQ
ncbi:MAG: hypothetical protein WC749_05295 [Dehalococcoidia bacterium]